MGDALLFGFDLQLGDQLTNAQVDALVEALSKSTGRWSLCAQRVDGDQLFRTLDMTNSDVIDFLRNNLTADWWNPPPPAMVGYNWGDDLRNPTNPTYRFTMRRLYKGVRPRDNRNLAYLAFKLSGDAKGLDLSRYQLYGDPQQEADSTHCLIQALRLAGIADAKLTEIDWKFIGKQQHITRKAFVDLAKTLNRKIVVIPLNKTENEKGFTRSRTLTYNKDAPGDAICFGLIHSHIFLNERTNYTGFYIRNMAKCNQHAAQAGWVDGREKLLINDPTKGKKGIRFDADRAMMSVELLKFLFFTNTSAEPLVVPDFSGVFARKRDAHNKDFYLRQDVVDISQMPFKVSTRVDSCPMYACDIEASVKGDRHIAIMAAAVRIEPSSDKPLEEAYGDASQVHLVSGKRCLMTLFENLAREVLDGMEVVEPVEESEFAEDQKYPEAITYWHNLRYDSKHLFQAFHVKSMVQKEQTLYGLSFWCGGVMFRCIDSLKVIDLALSEFQHELKLPSCFHKRGDVIAYTFFTPEHADDSDDFMCTVDHYVEGNTELRDDAEREEFKALVVAELEKDVELYGYDDGSFNPMRLYAEYLKWDVRVLAAGLVALRDAVNAIPGLSADIPVLGKMTLPSIAKTMFFREKCFSADEDDKPCIAPAGLLRSWLNRAVAGGRVMPSLSCPYGLVESRFQYLDANSLYPTSVMRICRELGGFPAGRCLLLAPDQLSGAFILDEKKVKTFVVRIRVTEIRRQQTCGIPAISWHDVEGKSRHYINEMPEGMDSFETYISKVALEDAINIHDIVYTVLEGIYYPHDVKMASRYGEVVNSLYNRRNHVERDEKGNVTVSVKKTAEGAVIKRVLNSGAYGVMIQKPSDIEFKFMPGSDVNTYCYNEFHRVHSFCKVGLQWMVQLYANDTSSMPVVWGISVLEMSRRVMNEVLSCLSDIGGTAFYTDTDSITIEEKDVVALGEAFRTKYGRELYGTQLGQLHSDFSMNDAHGKSIPDHKIVSVAFGCAGKKSYLHLLEGEGSDGKIHHGYKTSAKGITKDGLEYQALAMAPHTFDNEPRDVRVREGLRCLFRAICTKDDPGFEIDLFPGKKRKFVYTADTVSTESKRQFTRIFKNTRS